MINKNKGIYLGNESNRKRFIIYRKKFLNHYKTKAKMKRLPIIFNICVFFLLALTSCSKDDSYTNLSDEAKALLFYEVGDTFQMRNISTDEVITLTVNSNNIDFYKDSNPGFWLAGSSDNYIEYGSYSFSDDTNC